MRSLFALLLVLACGSVASATTIYGAGGTGGEDASLHAGATAGALVNGVAASNGTFGALGVDRTFVIWGAGGGASEAVEGVRGGSGGWVDGVIPAGWQFTLNGVGDTQMQMELLRLGPDDEILGFMNIIADMGGDASADVPGLAGTTDWGGEGAELAAAGMTFHEGYPGDEYPTEVPEPGSLPLGMAAVLAAVGLNERLSAGLVAIGAAITLVVGAFFSHLAVKVVMSWARRTA